MLIFINKIMRQPDYKPGYVGNRLPVRHLSIRRVATVANRFLLRAIDMSHHYNISMNIV